MFTRVTDPERWRSYIPGLVKAAGFSWSDLRPGTSFSWEWGVAGAATLSGNGQVTQNVPNALFAVQVEGKISFTARCTFTPTPSGTDLLVEVDYRSARDTLGEGFVATIVHGVKSGVMHAIMGKIRAACESP